MPLNPFRVPLSCSLQLHRARALRNVRGDAVFGDRAQYHQEPGGPLLVGANATQAQVLHRVPETLRRDARRALHE